MNKGCETGPPAYSPYPRRLESLAICFSNYKGSNFYSVILSPWVLVRRELNSRPPRHSPKLNQLSQVRGCYYVIITLNKLDKKMV